MSQFFEYTASGIKFKGFQDLLESLKEMWYGTFGEELDLSPTSPDGHHVALEAKTVLSISELLQAVTGTFNRQQATGVYLDNLAALLGLQRGEVDGEAESDDSLRQRMDAAETQGYATYDGMLTYLQNTVGTDIGLTVNDEPVADDDGIPGHSFRVVVPNTNATGNDDIAQAIWNCKPAGIKANGNASGTANDSAGMKHTVSFSRPESVNVEVKVTLSLYDEEAFPDNGTEAVKTAIESWATGTGEWSKAEYAPGKDVLAARFYTPIMTVPGIASATFSMRKTDGEWSADDIAISSEQIAVLSKIEVTKG